MDYLLNNHQNRTLMVSRVLLLLLCSFLAMSFCSAQAQSKIDSLQNILSVQSGEEQVLTLMELCYHTSKTDFERSREYGDKAVSKALQLHNTLLLGKAYKGLANTYMNASRFETAIDLNKKALKLFEDHRDQKMISAALNNLGNVYRRKGDFSKALEYYFHSLKLKDSLGGYKLGSAYTNIGHAYLRNEEDEKAIDFFFKALEYDKEKNDTTSLAIDYGNLGIAYENFGDYKLALDYANKALALDAAIEDNIGIAIDYNNMGAAYFGMKDYANAQKYFHKSLSLKKEINYEAGVEHTSQKLADLYLEKQNLDSALFYAEYSLELAKKMGRKNRIMTDYEVLSTIHEARGDAVLALGFYKKYETVKDAIFNLEREVLVKDMDSKYQAAQKDNRITNQQATIAQQRQMQLLYILLGAMLLAIIFGLIYGYRKGQSKNLKLHTLNKQLDTRNQQNELLLKEIHHRVKNNLEMVKSLISLQSAHMEDSETRDAMLASQNRVQSMGIIHQKLYQGDNLGSIEMKDYFINLSEGILDSFKAEDKVQIECLMDDLELDIDTAVPLGLIVNELLANAIKYAFPDSKEGIVRVSLKKEHDTLVMDVADNGVGKRTDQPAQGTGFGTQLVHLLTTQLNGKMHEEAKSGTHLSFTFNLDTVA